MKKRKPINKLNDLFCQCQIDHYNIKITFNNSYEIVTQKKKTLKWRVFRWVKLITLLKYTLTCLRQPFQQLTMNCVQPLLYSCIAQKQR